MNESEFVMAYRKMKNTKGPSIKPKYYLAAEYPDYLLCSPKLFKVFKKIIPLQERSRYRFKEVDGLTGLSIYTRNNL
jgi:hypothetical protein